MKKSFVSWSALALIAMAAGCAKSSSPTQPTDTAASTATVTTSTTSSTGGAVSGTESATVTAPVPAAPNDAAQIPYLSQPITLTVTNGVTTGKGTQTYTFEVATDSAFSSIAVTKDGVAAGSSQTSAVLSTLGGNTATTYYWRSRMVLGSSAGPNSKVRSFTVGPKIVIQAPVLATPGANAVVGGQPALTVNNAQFTGPAGTIVYTFQVAETQAFSPVVYQGTSVEQTSLGYTSHTVATQLSAQTYWWRVMATDTTNNITGPWSTANPFQVQLFDMRRAIIWDNPPDLGSWAETANITLADTSGEFVIVDFDKRLGPGHWPDVGFGSGSLEYTLGMCFNLDSQWHCSAAIQFWYGRELEAGGRTNEVGINWYYDARWGRMSGHQPAPGELVGIFVGAGNLRDSGNVITKERSNVVLMPYGSRYTPAALSRLPLTPITPTSFFKALRPGGR